MGPQAQGKEKERRSLGFAVSGPAANRQRLAVRGAFRGMSRRLLGDLSPSQPPTLGPCDDPTSGHDYYLPANPRSPSLLHRLYY